MTLLSFIGKIAPTEDCVEWPGYRDRRGYGRLTVRGHPGRLAHRASYEINRGHIPTGMTVDHICFNPGCINPTHLQLLSLSKNAQRQRSAERTHCKEGHEFTSENTYIKPGYTQKRKSA